MVSIALHYKPPITQEIVKTGDVRGWVVADADIGFGYHWMG